jgi:AcrR family transcriptional regulator
VNVDDADVTDVGLPCAEVRRPGRPRSSEADQAILDAAIEIYGALGLGGLTVDAVAALAGVSKATIYRRYPSKADLVIAAAHRAAEAKEPKAFTGDLRRDLRIVLEHLRAVMQDPKVGSACRMLTMDAHRDEQLRCLQREFVQLRRSRTTTLLADAIARRDLRADTDPHIASDQLSGPLFYRFLVSGEPIDDEFLDAVVDAFLRGYAP